MWNCWNYLSNFYAKKLHFCRIFWIFFQLLGAQKTVHKIALLEETCKLLPYCCHIAANSASVPSILCTAHLSFTVATSTAGFMVYYFFYSVSPYLHFTATSKWTIDSSSDYKLLLTQEPDKHSQPIVQSTPSCKRHLKHPRALQRNTCKINASMKVSVRLYTLNTIHLELLTYTV